MKRKIQSSRLLSILLSLAIVLSFTSFARVTINTVTVPTSAGSISFDGGTGTGGDPYLISTKDQLDEIRNDLTACYKLTADIVFTDADFAEGGAFYNEGIKWIPIGNDTNKFTGTFDGDGHTITNLQVNATAYYAGLFGYSVGTIKNIGMIDGNIVSTGFYVGGICGYSEGTIVNCYNTGSIKGASYVGGICGEADNAVTINNCYNIGNIIATDTCVGGICGYAYSFTINNCYNTGSVTGSYAGGICGQLSYVTIEDCYNLGNVSGKNGYSKFGAIAGSIYNTEITNCYYYDNVSKGIGSDDVEDTCISCSFEELIDKSTYAGFDFENVWEIDGTVDYKLPTLKNAKHAEKENNTTDFAGGNGRLYNPYLISTKEQLNKVRNDLTACYKLTADIVFTDADFAEGGAFYNEGIKWIPIGNDTNKFTGTFDGNGHVIKNLQINATSNYAGLFGYSSGIIKNIGLIGGNIVSSGYYVGGICGYSERTISNCFNTTKVNGSYYVGGICGEADNAVTINNCYNTGDIIASNTYAGGICGYAYSFTISNCYNTGSITGSYAGGICGTLSYVTIENCYNLGNVSGKNSYSIFGAIAGSVFNCEITDCYYYDNVSNGIGDDDVEDTCISCSSDELIDKSTYVGFDFDNVWIIDDSKGYLAPSLRSVSHVFSSQSLEVFDKGDGSKFAPYQIETKEQLNAVRNDLSANYILVADMEFTDAEFAVGGAFYNGGSGWLPIGDNSKMFTGTFDGNGHLIKNIKVNRGDRTGIFGYCNNATIKNLGIVGGHIRGGYYVGGICGMSSDSTISNCYNTSNVVGDYYIGGICGYITGSTLCDCYASSVISGKYIGGICGCANSSTDYITNCYSVSLLISGNYYFGGICGYADASPTISNCYYDNNVSKGIGYGNDTTTKCTYEELESKDTFVGFDFDETWEMSSLEEYPLPVLQSIAHVESNNTTDFAGGRGTHYNPYLIETKEQLNNIRNDLTASYKLTADIVFTDADFEEGGAFYNLGKGWNPIGDSTNKFTGIFDGNGHTINNLQINTTTDYVGLFGYCENATIKNFGLIDGNIVSTGNYVGGICGCAAVVENCYNTSNVSGNNYVGGICGRAFNNSTIKNCYNAGQLTVSDNYIGGICANASSNVEIVNCYNIGEIIGESATYKGGICGNAATNTSFIRCYYLDNSNNGVGTDTTKCVKCTFDEMLAVETFEDWDFDNTWLYDNNSNYPFPRLQGIPHVQKEDTVNFAGGNGRFYNPYKISTKEQLNNIRNDLTASYKLTADIVFTDADFVEGGAFYNSGAKWIPIGDSTNKFTGTFDGDGHIIRNLQINATTYYAGLFGYSSGTIMNLGLVDGNINSTSYYVGGICGYADASFVVKNCYYTGKIIGRESLGGICGYLKSSANITSCYNTGSVSGNDNVGGICGCAFSSSTITDCYNVGNLCCKNDDAKAGGICGYGSNINITNCYNLGNVSGRYAGGICGSEYNSVQATNCYYVNTSEKGIGFGTETCISCSIDALKNQDTYTGFDFSDVWEIDSTSKYPFPTLKAVKHIEKSDNKTDFDGGNGTIYKPYLISTKEQLNNVRNELAASYKLTADIVFTDADFAEGGTLYNNGKGWTPIGDSSNPFTGTFDGDGHIIKNLQINTTTNQVGLFGYGYNSIIKNLRLSGGNISSTGKYVSGICGKLFDAKIQECCFSGIVSGTEYVGGICGYAGSSSILNCYSTATIVGCKYVGGICGYGYKISNCYNSGKIICEGKTNPYIGGICGSANEIANCYNFGSIYASDMSYAGGICYSADTINNCYYLNSISRGKDGTDNCVSCTFEQMKLKATYVGFDFENVWTIDSSAKYPLPTLKSLPHSEIEDTTNFAGGNGSVFNPYLISTKEQLNNVRNDLTASYKLIEDIEFSDSDFEFSGGFYNGGAKWLPIGNATNKFMGTFDGNGHTITNLQTNSKIDYTGLFGYTYYATIKDVGMKGGNIVSTANYVGSICGYADKSTITKSYSASLVKSTGTNAYVGGVCGYASSSTIDCCYNIGSVNSAYRSGGICGCIDGSTIENCYNKGYISSSNYAGGICSYANNSSEILKCYNIGDVTSTANYYDYESAICSCLYNNSTATYCYYRDNISQGIYSGTDNCTACTISDLMKQSTYVGFDFDNVWNFNSSSSYPIPTLKGVNHTEINDTVNFAGGDGTLFNPYLISTKAQLSNIRNNLSAEYKLTNNITFENSDFAEGGMFYNAGKKWIPIGDSSNPFTGTLDGNGYSIINLQINSSSYYSGLFGYSKGTIKNLGLVKGTTESSYSYVGGFCGVLGDKGLITNCYNASSITSSSDYVGGVCGEITETARIENCYNIGTILGEDEVGGICGYAQKDSNIKYCYNAGLVKGYSSVGGICGYSSSGNISSCYYQDTTSAGVGSGTDNCTKCTSSAMQQQSTFKGFDFTNVWTLDTSASYNFPMLKSVKHVEGGENITEFLGGNGTLNNPYLISSKAHLYNVRKYPNACFKLMKNIVFNDTDFAKTGEYYNNGKGWEPIGDKTVPFSGCFDGNGYSVKNLVIADSKNQYTGLFGYVTGTVKNLGMSNAKLGTNYIEGDAYLGAICGYNNGLIDNCYLDSGDFNINLDDSDFSYYEGGIVGNNIGDILHCYTLGNISANKSFGGICGRNDNLISYCYNKANLTVPAYVAGICYYFDDGTISYCYNSGNITAISDHYLGADAAGICYNAKYSVDIHDCFNSGKITASRYSCGIVTYLYSGSKICNCYNIGKCVKQVNDWIYNDETGRTEEVTVEKDGYAIAYSISYAEAFENCYYLDNMANSVDNLYQTLDSSVKLSSAEMKNKVSFEGFDFENVWYIDSCKYEYPVLRGTDVQEVKSIEPVGNVQLVTTQGLNPSADGQKVKVVYKDGSQYTVAIKAEFIKDFDKLEAGEFQYYLQAGDAVSTNQITVLVGERILKSIAVTASPKTTYVQRQNLSADGGKLTLTFDNGTTKEIDLTNDMLSGDTKTVGDNQKVVVSYGGKTTSYKINVKKRTVIDYQLQEPENLVYLVGEDFNYNDGGIKEIFESEDSYYELIPFSTSNVSGFDSSKAGIISIGVKYKTLEDRIVLRIIEQNIEDVEFISLPKTQYYIGEPLDVSSGQLLVSYAYDTTRVVDIDESMISGFNSSVVADSKPITITYMGKTLQYNISVTNRKNLSGVATIDGDLEYSDEAVVNVSRLNGTGEYSYQWYYDDFSSGNKIEGATSKAYLIGSSKDIGHTLCCEIKNSRETGTIYSMNSGVIQKKTGSSAPSGINSTYLSNSTASDGTITGVSQDMEYRLSTSNVWIPVPNTNKISNLSAGTYLVRYKETSVSKESNFATVKITTENSGGDPIEKPSLFDTSHYARVAGANRYATSTVVADANASVIGVEKYDSIIVVTGKDFADALSATYLSAMLGAPIISTKPEGMTDTTTYITAHLNNGGKVYVVGGENAISSSYFSTLSTAIGAIPDTSIERLAGKNRYKTNAIVLEKAYEIEQDKGLTSPEYAFICTGTGYADALSASAVGAPIILVKPETGLCDEQKAYLEKRQNDSKAFDMLYVIGGDKAVSDANANSAKAYTNDKAFTRLGGANRYATSKLVADTFFDNTSATNTIVLAYAKNYPDALAGGLLAYSLNAPLILTVDDNNTAAKEYVTSMDGQIEYAVVLGGSGLVSDATVNTIMGTSGVAVENFD